VTLVAWDFDSNAAIDAARVGTPAAIAANHRNLHNASPVPQIGFRVQADAARETSDRVLNGGSLGINVPNVSTGNGGVGTGLGLANNATITEQVTTNNVWWYTQISTKGHTDIEVEWRMRSNAGGPRDWRVDFSIDGTNWTSTNTVYGINLLGTTTNTDTWNRFTQALPAAADDKDVVHIRWVMASQFAQNGTALAGGGAHQINRIFIRGTPVAGAAAPVATPTSLTTGTVFVGTGAGNASNSNALAAAGSSITINSDSDTVTYYTITTDGNEPDEPDDSSTAYQGSGIPLSGLTLNADTSAIRVKAISYDDSGDPSRLPSVIANFTFRYVHEVSAARGSANNVVINRVFGGGGSGNRTFSHSFIELYNPTASDVDLDGWSVRYINGAVFPAATTQNTITKADAADGNTIIKAGGYYLLRLNAANTGGNMTGTFTRQLLMPGETKAGSVDEANTVQADWASAIGANLSAGAINNYVLANDNAVVEWNEFEGFTSGNVVDFVAHTNASIYNHIFPSSSQLPSAITSWAGANDVLARQTDGHQSSPQDMSKDFERIVGGVDRLPHNSWFGLSETQVAKPTAYPASGAYVLNGAEIALSTITENATIYYTLDGEDPDETSEEYTVPFALDFAGEDTITVKAIAVKDTYEDSEIAEFMYNRIKPLTIAAARALAVETNNKSAEIVQITGVITARDAQTAYSSGRADSVIIQDGAAGITVRLPQNVINNYTGTAFSSRNLNIGDQITVTGNKEVYNGLTQLSGPGSTFPASLATFISKTDGTVPITPPTLDIANLQTNGSSLVSQLVTLAGEFTIGDSRITGASQSNKFTEIKQGSTTVYAKFLDINGNILSGSYIPVKETVYEITRAVVSYTSVEDGELPFTARYVLLIPYGSYSLMGVEHPIANPPAGAVVSGTPVTLTSATGGATIFYTTDGSDPISSGTREQYSTPIPITAAVTIRAVAELGGTFSTVFEAAYTIITITPIADVLDMADGVTVTVEGILTYNNRTNAGADNGVFLQDESGAGIAVRPTAESDRTTLRGMIGQKVRVTGNTATNMLLRQLVPTMANVVPVDANPVQPTPILVTTADLFATPQTHRNMLVKMENAQVTVITAATGQNVQANHTISQNGVAVRLIGPFPLQYSDETAVVVGDFINISRGISAIMNDNNVIFVNNELHITRGVAPVTATPGASAVVSGTTVALSSATTAATIYYTTDGSDPISSGTRVQYTTPIPITAAVTIRAVAQVSANFSAVSEFAYTITTVLQPTANPPAGAVVSGTPVTLSSVTGGATIFYTTDGSDPTISSGTRVQYSTPIPITAAVTIRAVAFLGGNYSPVVSFAYTVITITPIADAIALPAATVVTVEGVITYDNANAANNGSNGAFVQDASGAGIVVRLTENAAARTTLAGMLGQRIRVTGPIVNFNGLIQIETTMANVTVVNPTPTTLPTVLASVQDIVDRTHPFALVSLENVKLVTKAPGTSGHVTHRIEQNGVQVAFFGPAVIPFNQGDWITINRGVSSVSSNTRQLYVNVDNVDGIVAGIADVTTTTAPGAVLTGTLVPLSSVSVHAGAPDAVILFTTNGDDPITNGTLYSTPISVDTAMTIKAVVRTGAAGSFKFGPVSSFAYTTTDVLLPDAPTANPPGGAFNEGRVVLITLSSATPGVQILYTTNGTDPATTAGGATSLYTVPFALNFGTADEITLKAIVVDNGVSSLVAEFTYIKVPNVLINQAFGGGGSGTKTYRHCFVELYNPTSEPVDMTGWTIQYAGGSNVFGSGVAVMSAPFPTGTTIQPGRYFLVRLGAQNANAGSRDADFPTHDFDGGGVNIAAAVNSVVLATNNTVVTYSPSTGGQIGGAANWTTNNVVDFIAANASPFIWYGERFTTPATATSSVIRKTDTNGIPINTYNHANDLEVMALAAPSRAPRNSAFNPSAIAVPTASPAPGDVTSGTTVTLSTTTLGGVIYFTLDGSDPTEPSNPNRAIFTAGATVIAITDATTVKAATFIGGVYSDVATFNYTIATIISIAEAITRPTGSTVIVEGILTYNTLNAAGATNNGVFMQDGGAGICVRPAGQADRDLLLGMIGQKVRVTGSLANFSGLIQIEPTMANIVVTDPSPTMPEPIPVTITDINERTHPFKLVSLANVRLISKGDTFTGGHSTYIISDGNTTSTLYGPAALPSNVALGDWITITRGVSSVGGYTATANTAIMYVNSNDSAAIVPGNEPPPDDGTDGEEIIAQWNHVPPTQSNRTAPFDAQNGVYTGSSSINVSTGVYNTTASSNTIWYAVTTGGPRWEIKTSTKDFVKVNLTYRAYGNAAIPNWEITYSTDGITFRSFEEPITYGMTATSVNGAHTFNFDLPDVVDNLDVLYLRIGTTATSGSARLLMPITITGQYALADTQLRRVSGTPSGSIGGFDVLKFVPNFWDRDVYGNLPANYVIQVSKTGLASSWENLNSAFEYPVNNELPLTLFARAATSDDSRIPSRAVRFDYTAGELNLVTARRNYAATEITLSHETEGSTIMYTIMEGEEGVGSHSNPIEYIAPITKLPDGTYIGPSGTYEIIAWAEMSGWATSEPAVFNFGPVSVGGEKIYFGQIHSHSTLSDGQGTVEEAYDYARNDAKLDFFAVTDHSNSFDGETPGDTFADDKNINHKNLTSARWQNGLRAAADEFSAGCTCNAVCIDPDACRPFISFFGYEMTWSGGPGHINTFNTEGFVSRNNPNLNAKPNDAGMRLYYELLQNTPGSISMFNHPGTTFGNFNNFGYHDPVLNQYITLIEVGNGEGAVNSSGYWRSYDQYNLALDKGWLLAPTNNQDNHNRGWGNSNTARTAIWTNDLSLEGVYNAFRDMRVYATEVDDLLIDYRVNGEPLGSVINVVPDASTFTASVETKKAGHFIRSVGLVTNGGVEIRIDSIGNVLPGEGNRVIPSNTQKWDYNKTFAATAGWYYLRVVIGTPSGDHFAVTAPVWLGQGKLAGFTDLTSDTRMPVTGQELILTSELFNRENRDVELLSLVYTQSNGRLVGNMMPAPVTIKAGDDFEHKQSFTPMVAGEETITATAVIRFPDGEGFIDRRYTFDITFNVRDAEKVLYIGIDAAHFNEYIDGQYRDSFTNFAGIAADMSLVTVVLRSDEDIINAANNPKFQFLLFAPPGRHSGILNDPARGEHRNYSQGVVEAVANFAKNGGMVAIVGFGNFNDSGTSTPLINASPGGRAEAAHSYQQNRLLSAMGSNIRVGNTSHDAPIGFREAGAHQHDLRYANNFNLNNPFMAGVIPLELDPNRKGQLYRNFSTGALYVVDDAELIIPTGTSQIVSGATALPEGVNPMILAHPGSVTVDSNGGFTKVPAPGAAFPRYAHPNPTIGLVPAPAEGTAAGQRPAAGGRDPGQHLIAASQPVGKGTVLVFASNFFSNFDVQREVDNPSDLPNANYTISYNLLSNMAPEAEIDKIADVWAAEWGEFTVEGIVTSNVYGATAGHTGFFDSIYIQDDTRGINIFPVAFGVELGQKVRVVGTVSQFMGEKQLNISSITVIDSNVSPVTPLRVTTERAMASINTGNLIQTNGFVSNIVDTGGTISQFTLTDASGTGALVFINAYITPTVDLSFIREGAAVSVTGLASVGEAVDGGESVVRPRIRVRNRAEIVQTFATVTLNSTALRLNPGDTPPLTELTATVAPVTAAINDSVVWSSSNPDIVDFVRDSAGNVVTTTDGDKVTVTLIAKEIGTAVIMARSERNSAVLDLCYVTVVPIPTVIPDIVITSSPVNLVNADGRITDALINESITLFAAPSEGVRWSSSSTRIATVNATSGEVTYRAAGTTTITATIVSGTSRITESITLTIIDTTPRLPVSSVTLYTRSTLGAEFIALPGDNAPFDNIEVDGNPDFTINSAIDDNTYRITHTDPTEARNGRVTLTLQATIGEGPEKKNVGDTFRLTVNVATGVPSSRVRMSRLNTFWKDVEGSIRITGTNLPEISDIILAPAVAENFEIIRSMDGEFTIRANRDFDVNVPFVVRGNLEIRYKGFPQDTANAHVIRNFTVPVRSVTPRLTLSPATQTINTTQFRQVQFEVAGGRIERDGVRFTPNGNPKRRVGQDVFDVFSVPDNVGNTITLQLLNFHTRNTQRFRPQLEVMLDGARNPIVIRPIIMTAHGPTTYRLSTSTVSLNSSLLNQSQTIRVIPNHSNVNIDTIDITPRSDNAPGVTVSRVGSTSELRISVDNDARSGTRRFDISPNGTRTRVLKVNVNSRPIGAGRSNLSVSVRADRGNINLRDRENTLISYAPIISGTASRIRSVSAVPARGDYPDYTGLFDVRWNAVTGRVVVRAKPGETYERDAVYRIRFEFSLEGGNSLTTGNIAIRPEQSAVRHNIPRQTMYHSRTGTQHREIIDLTPVSPLGARVATMDFKTNPNGAYWFHFDEENQQLHVWIRDNSRLMMGRYNLVFSVTYEGQGVERSGAREGQPRLIDLTVPVNVRR
jgi:hypothetical protein